MDGYSFCNFHLKVFSGASFPRAFVSAPIDNFSKFDILGVWFETDGLSQTISFVLVLSQDVSNGNCRKRHRTVGSQTQFYAYLILGERMI